MNWIGLATLYKKEVLRFLKVWNQTLVAPVITTLLFLAIFSLSMGGDQKSIEGIPFNIFITPGLIMMAMVQNSFGNTSSSLILAKIQGVIVDYLMPPISPGEFVAAIALGGLTRGLMVGLVVGISVSFFIPLGIHSIGGVIIFAGLASLMLALLGVLAGVWSQTFDHLAAITNYIIVPLSFLSGTFYSVNQLPAPWDTLAHYNPFFQMIDGFRWALTGYSDSNIKISIVVLSISSIVIYLLTYHIISRGYRLKS